MGRFSEYTVIEQHGRARMMKGKGLSSKAIPGPLWGAVFFLCLSAQSFAVQQDAEQCAAYYHPDDPNLFEFVETRREVRYESLAGKTIGELRYVVLPIFDERNPEENNWLYRTFNALHIPTRPGTLKKQMIIEPGAPLDVTRLEENERLLRDNKYLSDAMIVPHRVCEESVDLLVVVRDVWTLTPSASVSRSGGENSTGAGLSDDNLFGTGQELSIGYSDNADRTSRSISFRSPQLFSNHTRLYLAYADHSDGKLAAVDLRRPFYSLNSRWSAGAAVTDETQEVEIEEDGETVNTFSRESYDFEMFYGFSRGLRNNRVNRWLVGFTENEDRFSTVSGEPSEPPADTRVRYPWVGWEFLENRYLTTSNITYSHRQEDLLLGASASARLGYASKEVGSTENAFVFSLDTGYTASFGKHHLMRLNAWSSGRYDTDKEAPVSTFFAASLSYYNFIDRKNRWYLDFRFDGGRNLRLDEEFTTGGEGTLRGYPEEVQRGNRRWVFHAERRHFTDIHLFNLAWLGGAAYVDVGKTWNTEVPESEDNPVLSNFGLGLRFSPSKFRIDKVLHLDVAIPLVERDNIDAYQIIVASRVDF